jgi:hypothetical protein
LRLPNIEQKEKFISIIAKNELSVRELTKLISETKKITNKEKSIYSVINNPDELFSDKYVEKLKLTELNNISIDKLKQIESKLYKECREYEKARFAYSNKSDICNSYVIKYLDVLTDVKTVIDYKQNPSSTKKLKKSKTKMARP